MFKQVVFAAILIIAVTVTGNGQIAKNFGADSNANGPWEEPLGGAEAARAIARLGYLAPTAIRERLKQLRQPDNLSSKALMNQIVQAQELPIVNTSRVAQLKAALQPVLDYHERSRMPIYVLRSDHPKAYMVECSVIIITTRMMDIASEEEIRGIVAHELAHEYVWNECARALKEKNWKLRRECELFCDSVAAFTLREIGDDPASYGRILERLTYIGINAGSTTRAETDTYPSLGERKKLNKFLCRVLI